jgi:hypothetical protein
MESAVDLTPETMWCALVASVLLTPLALLTGSWFTMWVAALLSTAVSFLGVFSVGPLTFLLTCLQLAGAIALRRSTAEPEWRPWLLLALGVWALVVPLQTVSFAITGFGVLGWYYAFPLIAAVVTIAVFISPVIRPQRA